jgi:DKNYY family
MKMFKLIALFSLIAFISAITIAYYTYYKTTRVGGEKGVTPVWYSKSMFYVYISRVRSSGGFFPVDYTETSRIEGADFNTFEYIDDGFAKDKNYFYYPSEVTVRRPGKIDYSYFKAEGVELDSHKHIRTVFVELGDDSLLYWKYYILSDTVFHVMKSNSSYSGQSDTWGRVGRKGSNVNNSTWHKFDYETFVPFSCGYTKDKNGVYPMLLDSFGTIEDVDIESFTAKSVPYSESNHEGCYATDKNYQYYYFRDKDNNLEVKRKPLADTDNR